MHFVAVPGEKSNGAIGLPPSCGRSSCDGGSAVKARKDTAQEGTPINYLGLEFQKTNLSQAASDHELFRGVEVPDAMVRITGRNRASRCPFFWSFSDRFLLLGL
jgi:hypothetical protein